MLYRWLRAVLVLCCVPFMPVVGGCHGGGHKSACVSVTERLEVRELVLVDEEGCARMVLDGHKASGCGAMRIRTADGRVIGELLAGDDGSSQLTLRDGHSKPAIVMITHAEGGALISCVDPSGMPRSLISYEESDGASLRLVDEDGVSTASFFAPTSGGVIATLQEGAGQARSTWFVAPNGKANLFFTDNRGEETWRALDDDVSPATTRPADGRGLSGDAAKLAIVSLSQEPDATHEETILDATGATWYRSRPVFTLADCRPNAAWVYQIGDEEYTISILLKESTAPKALTWSQDHQGETFGIIIDHTLRCVVELRGLHSGGFFLCSFPDRETAEEVLRGLQTAE